MKLGEGNTIEHVGLLWFIFYPSLWNGEQTYQKEYSWRNKAQNSWIQMLFMNQSSMFAINWKFVEEMILSPDQWQGEVRAPPCLCILWFLYFWNRRSALSQTWSYTKMFSSTCVIAIEKLNTTAEHPARIHTENVSNTDALRENTNCRKSTKKQNFLYIPVLQSFGNYHLLDFIIAMLPAHYSLLIRCTPSPWSYEYVGDMCFAKNLENLHLKPKSINPATIDRAFSSFWRTSIVQLREALKAMQALSFWGCY